MADKINYSKAITIIPSSCGKPSGKIVDLAILRKICNQNNLDLKSVIKDINNNK